MEVDHSVLHRLLGVYHRLGSGGAYVISQCIAAGAFTGLFAFWWIIKVFGLEDDE